MMKTWLGFSDLAVIFKVTVELNRSNLNEKELVCKIYGGGHKFSLKNTSF